MKTLQKKMQENRQYRAMQMISLINSEKKFDSDYYIEGYAAKFEPYVLYENEDGAIYERFDRSAFVDCDMSDVIFQYDHQGKVFARQSNNTLYIDINDNGIFVCADLSKTTSSRQMWEEINTGLITKMSWGFLPKEYYFDKQSRTLIHTKVKKIFDVSAVSIPANNDTDIHARSFVDGEINLMMQELQEQKRQKDYLNLKLKLGGI